MNRRGFLLGGATLLVGPAIVRVASLMPISVIEPATIWWKAVMVEPDWDQLALSPRMINVFKRQILKHAVPLEVLGRHVHSSTVTVERRWLPYRVGDVVRST